MIKSKRGHIQLHVSTFLEELKVSRSFSRIRIKAAAQIIENEFEDSESDDYEPQ